MEVERKANSHKWEPVEVLHVVEATLGGLRRHVLDLVQGLDALGVRQAVVYSPLRADSGWAEGLRWCAEAGIRTVPVAMRREIRPWADLSAVTALRRIARQSATRILHLHSSKAGGLGRLAGLLLPGVKTVYTPNASPANLSRWFALVEQLLGRLRTDRLIAVSVSEQVALRALKFVPDRRLVLIESGVSVVEVDRLARVAPAIAVPSSPIVVACGRMTHQKNPFFLADVSQRVLRVLPETQFVWVGDGELRGEFEARVQRLGIAAAWSITGWLLNALPIIARASVFAMPSIYESYGYVTLEAMLLERPVVGSDAVGTVDLIIPGETGDLVPQGSVEAFTDAIVALLQNPVRARMLGRRAREVGLRFSLDRMGSETLSMYRELAPGVGPERDAKGLFPQRRPENR